MTTSNGIVPSKKARNKLDYTWPTVTLTVPGFDPIRVNVTTLPEEVQRYATLFGVGNRLHNSTAGKSGAEAWAAAAQTADTLKKAWRLSASTPKRIDKELIIRAVARIKEVSVEEVTKASLEWDDAKWAGLAASGKVELAILDIKKEMAQKQPITEDFVDSLDV